MVSRTKRGLDFMARYRIKGFSTPNLELATAWQTVLREHGRETDLGADLLFSMAGHLADSVASALKETRPYREEVLKRHAAEGFPRGLTDEQVAMLANPATAAKIDVDLDRTASALYGPPDEIIEKLLAIQERYPGLEEINFDPSEATPLSTILQQLEWFGEAVIKPFKALTGQSEDRSLEIAVPTTE
jgi:alkanesulfonate monooxygenase SsuD/methylene tetrahydromethanopterin reductase-like flavin-dependent oxidoreductase (luciferase family)